MDVTEGDRHEVALPNKEWHFALTDMLNLLAGHFILGSAIQVQNS